MVVMVVLCEVRCASKAYAKETSRGCYNPDTTCQKTAVCGVFSSVIRGKYYKKLGKYVLLTNLTSDRVAQTQEMGTFFTLKYFCSPVVRV